MPSKRPPASLQHLKTRLGLLQYPAAWGALSVLLLAIFLVAEYWDHLEKYIGQSDRPSSTRVHTNSLRRPAGWDPYSAGGELAPVPALPDDLAQPAPGLTPSPAATPPTRSSLKRAASDRVDQLNGNRLDTRIPSVFDAVGANRLNSTSRSTTRTGAAADANRQTPGSLPATADSPPAPDGLGSASPAPPADASSAPAAAGLNPSAPQPSTSSVPFSPQIPTQTYTPQPSAAGSTGYTVPPAFSTAPIAGQSTNFAPAGNGFSSPSRPQSTAGQAGAAGSLVSPSQLGGYGSFQRVGPAQSPTGSFGASVGGPSSGAAASP